MMSGSYLTNNNFEMLLVSSIGQHMVRLGSLVIPTTTCYCRLRCMVMQCRLHAPLARLIGPQFSRGFSW